jgi:tetrahydromethanopterin S-methyltransferase subunit C
MRRVWWWRRAVMLVGSGVLLQTAGCNLDQATVDSLVAAIVQVVVQALLGSMTGTGTFTTV